MSTIITSMTVSYHRIYGDRRPQKLTRVFDAGQEEHCFARMITTIEGSSNERPSIVLTVSVITVTEKDITTFFVAKKVPSKPKYIPAPNYHAQLGLKQILNNKPI